MPPHLDDRAVLGAVVRVPLHGRRVRGWIVDADADPPPGVALRDLTKVTGLGPSAEVLDLAAWAAWRWAGRRVGFLRTASPDRVVPGLPAPALGVVPTSAADPLAAALLAADGGVLRLPPTASRYPVAVAAVAEAARRGGSALVLVASVAQAAQLARRLRAEGVPVALMPDDWARARAGCVVVGTRASAWAPAADLAAVVMFDEHDEVWQEERAPTWHARDVVRERARRAGAPCLVVSPAPTLEALRVGPVVAADRVVERAGWPLLEVVDRRDDDPTTGLFSEVLVRRLTAGGRAVCVLNRTGRARLLACGRCRELARCEVCEAAVRQDSEGRLVCPRCGAERPVVCANCGSTRLRLLRLGVTRAREELAALLGEPVGEVTGASDAEVPTDRVVIGTEAVLHRIGRADVVAFLEMDQELLAPRYRAAEEALALLIRAGRLVGPRSAGGRIVVQTSVPRHEVLDAVEHGDPERVAAVEQARRVVMRFPPECVLADVSGAAADAFIGSLPPSAGVEVLGPDRGHWLLRAPDHATLADVLAATARPAGRLRVAVDPLRI